MIFVLCVSVAVTFAVSVFLLLGRELKGIAMGVFLLGHAANLAILAGSGSPIKPGYRHGVGGAEIRRPPVSDYDFDGAVRAGEIPDPLTQMVDPLPQALILTAIVIGFAVMGFLLSLLVVTSRKVGTLTLDELSGLDDDADRDAGADAFGPLAGAISTPNAAAAAPAAGGAA